LTQKSIKNYLKFAPPAFQSKKVKNQKNTEKYFIQFNTSSNNDLFARNLPITENFAHKSAV